MYIILQNDALEEEEFIIEKLIKQSRYTVDYIKASLKNINSINLKEGYIPIGTIEFVTKILTKIYPDFKREQPIEIPTYLQTDEFLKRIYKVGTWEDIPKSGRWFIKDASELKYFSILTNMDFFYNEELFDYKPRNELDSTLILHKSHDYIISSPFNIKSEYRVYVLDGKIENIALYNGDATLLPDIKLIQKAVNLINYNEKYLKSYSLDVMVGDKGTAIIEIHNFTSLGLYSTLWGTDLLYAYRDGIDYLINDNGVKYK